MVQNGISISSPESQWGQKGPAAVLTEVVAAATLQAAWMVVGTSGAEGKWQQSQEAIITFSEWTANGQTGIIIPSACSSWPIAGLKTGGYV